MRLFNFLLSFCVVLLLSLLPVKAEVVNDIEITGNERISTETIKMFIETNINDDLKTNDINEILKKLYQTNFFKDVSIELISNKLFINVNENPLVENINYNGIKSETIKEKVIENLNLRSRTSFNEIALKKDKDIILSSLKNLGYYFSVVNIEVIELQNNKIDLNFNIDLGNKAKIKKISFIGDKKYKDSKLKSLIISEEYKFWKIISGKKYLNENMINFDEKLLKNFYLNKGFYDIEINSSFAKMINDDEFELIYNINAKNKFFFGDLKLTLPTDFDPANFDDLKSLFSDLKDKPYSLNSVEKIINEIDQISTYDQYESVKANVVEKIISNTINLDFVIEDSERFLVEKINIFGNNVTRENVIRNRLFIDEGDPYNEIKNSKTINEIKSLNFFKDVKSEVIDGKNENSKIINIIVEEKPTGEISAGAGFGTTGSVIEFAVRENNYLGKGLAVDTAISLGSDKISGKFNLQNPNFNNSDKSLNFGLEATELDKLSSYGYKSNRLGASVGTNFEYLDDFRLGLETSSFLEKIETDSTASVRQKSQEGNYFDTYLNLNFDYDKRNQRFKTSDGFRSFYSVGLPVVSDNNTLKNYYNYKIYSELYENNISSFSVSLGAANSLTGDDIKLSERLFVPQNKLRGFVKGKVGPKDGNDFIGGNYYTLMNFSSTLPQILPNVQNVDFISFVDMANLWGVDDDSLNDGSKLRSSVGISVDWFTVVGPLSFSLATPITKSSLDKTESFRFNLGTSF